MIKGTLVFAAAFGICALLGSAAASCSSACDCKAPPPLPSPQPALPIADAHSYDAQGGEAILPINPVGGTLEVLGETLVIRYQEAGVQHEVVYFVYENP